MEFSMLWMLFLCFFVGLSLGLLGGGGTILTVPIFVYAGGMPAKEAISMSLIVVGTVALAGSLKFHKQGFVNIRLAVLFALAGMPSAWFGAKLTSLVSGQTLLLIFGMLMCVIALILFFKSQEKGAEGPVVCKPNILTSLALGVLIGTLTGFLGVGGGFLIVPAISILMRCSLHTAIGTSLAVIAVNSFAGFAGHLRDFTFQPGLLAMVLAVMIFGAVTGSKTAVRVSAVLLQRGFSLLILATGIFIIFKNLSY